MFEERRLGKCIETSLCAVFISVYLLLLWATKLLQGSLGVSGARRVNLSIEKIATTKGLGWRHTAQGFLTLVTGVCGIFPFFMMSSERMDRSTVTVVGHTGTVASFAVGISEAYFCLKAQNLRTPQTDSVLEERKTEK